MFTFSKDFDAVDLSAENHSIKSRTFVKHFDEHVELKQFALFDSGAACHYFIFVTTRTAKCLGSSRFDESTRSIRIPHPTMALLRERYKDSCGPLGFTDSDILDLVQWILENFQDPTIPEMQDLRGVEI